MKEKIKILYIVRDNFKEVFGGDNVQFSKTKEFMEKYGIEIDVVLAKDMKHKKDLFDYDLYHAWGLFNVLAFAKELKSIKEHDKKIILSSIYWDISHTHFLKWFTSILTRYRLYPILEQIKPFYLNWICPVFAYLLPPLWKKIPNMYSSSIFKKRRQEIINFADFIIPNSDEEGEILCRDIGLNYDKIKERFVSIPNAVDVNKLNQTCDEQVLPDLKDFVIEAAGIEPCKNQLGVIRALMDKKDIPIVFAGAVRNELYYSEVKKLAEKRGNVYFTGRIEEAQLFDLYKRATVHVLASLRESPGLATIEALMNGCQIVAANEKYCPIKYYQFDKYGFICNPYDVKSIRNAIINAYEHPKDIKLPDEYYKFFSYETVAKMTLEVYKKCLDGENEK